MLRYSVHCHLLVTGNSEMIKSIVNCIVSGRVGGMLIDDMKSNEMKYNFFVCLFVLFLLLNPVFISLWCMVYFLS